MGSDPVSQTSPDSPLDRNAFTVMLVEDAPLLAELLRRCLSSEPGIEILATTGDGESAVNLARELRPDAVIMDIELEGEMNGIEAANRIKAERGDTGVVILSTHKSRRYIESLPLR